MLDGGLTHMNGRLYDPTLARFVSADPYVDNPFDLQSLNRYSYVNNNPLGYTDPTGYFKLFGKKWSWWRDKVVRVAAAVADIFFYCNGYCTATVRAYGAYKQGGVSAAIFSAYQGFNQQSSTFWGYNSNRTIYNSIVSSQQSPTFNAEQFVLNTVLAGTAAELSGGKFANGALSGAFAYANNHIASYREDAIYHFGGITSNLDECGQGKSGNCSSTGPLEKQNNAAVGFIDKIINYVGNAIGAVGHYFQGVSIREYLGSGGSRAGGAMSVPVAAGVGALNVETAGTIVNIRIRKNATNCYASGACNEAEYIQIINDMSTGNYKNSAKMLNEKGYQ